MQSLMCTLDELRALAQSAIPDPGLWNGDAARAFGVQLDELAAELAALQTQLAQVPTISLDLVGVAA